jgi:hypothetical protein
MPNQANPNLGNTDTASSQDKFDTSVTGKDSKLDRIAEKAAQKASKTEKDYDRDHTIISK